MGVHCTNKMGGGLVLRVLTGVFCESRDPGLRGRLDSDLKSPILGFDLWLILTEFTAVGNCDGVSATKTSFCSLIFFV